MEPKGRCNGHFEPKRQSGDDRADDEDHEHGGSVAAVLRAEIEIAMGAPVGDSQEAAKKSAGATSWAPAAQSSRVGGKGWEGVRHPLAISRPTNRRKRRGTARQRQRSANTRLPLRNRNDGRV